MISLIDLLENKGIIILIIYNINNSIYLIDFFVLRLFNEIVKWEIYNWFMVKK